MESFILTLIFKPLIAIKIVISLLIIAILQSCGLPDGYQLTSEVPNLTMPDNGLRYKEIEDYKNYTIAATHFDADNNELL